MRNYNVKYTIIVFLAFLFLLLLSCASSSRLISQYQENLSENKNNTELKNKKTPVILILVDGLGFGAYSNESRLGHLKYTNLFFNSKSKKIKYSLNDLNEKLKNQKSFKPGVSPLGEANTYIGITQFPSLTFPNISSILMHKPISQHWVAHNKLYFAYENDENRGQKEVLNLELPLGLKKLNKKIQNQTLFGELKAQGKHSVSFAHSIYADSDVHLGIDVETGIYFLSSEISLVDENTINAFSDFIKETDYKNWPEFIFVHLTGYDSLAHEFGSQSTEAKTYIAKLDKKMKPIFEQLKMMDEKHHSITTILTSDHGFVDPKKRINLEKKLIHKQDDLVVLNEGRLLSVYFKNGASKTELEKFAQDIKSENGVGLVSYRHLNEVVVMSKDQKLNIFYRMHQCGESSYQIAIQFDGVNRSEWFCPQVIDSYYQFKNYPQFFSLIANYFESSGHTDLLILADDNVNFSEKEIGVHGGLTSDELFIPILIKNGSISLPPHSPLQHAVLNSKTNQTYDFPKIYNYQLLNFLIPTEKESKILLLDEKMN